MKFGMLMDNPNGSAELYEQIRAKVGVEATPAGGLVHVAGPSPNGGWRVIEVWETEDHAKQFVAQRLRPALAELGAPDPPQPQLWPVHTLLP